MALLREIQGWPEIADIIFRAACGTSLIDVIRRSSF